MPRVLILRDRAYTGMLSALAIGVDGETVSKVRRGGRVWCDIPDGEHEVTVRMNTLRSLPLTVSSAEGDSLRLACGCRGYGESMYAWLKVAAYEYRHF
jgi:hypothetical protein